MELSKTDAMEIVVEISNLLNKKLNLMNDKGIIIASSDKSRINTFHEGAYKIISEKLPELEVQEKNLNLKGTDIGLNFPIEINNGIVGVVGITGNSEETRAFGKIVKKMTEILLEGKAREEEKRTKVTVRNYFLVDWILSNNTIFNDQFIQRGLELNIDIQQKRRIICLDLSLSNKIKLLDLEKHVINKLTSLYPKNIVLKDSNSIILATPLLDKDKLNKQLISLVDFVSAYNAKIFIGVSDAIELFYNINSYYINAKHALTIQKSKNKNGISYYTDLNIELIYENVPINTKNQVLTKVFNKYKNEDLHKIINILKIYYDSNGSIQKASTLLNMHSNTVQYHLNKIKENTNLDPRNIKDSMIFQIAIDFFYELNY
ncbi:MAG: helix-turn-helix domain-containing protein [Sphaerochaetaceae bacterium]|nr:helix-turn-helix domain-containing protein [Sphaerochaetaceae bacterium]